MIEFWAKAQGDKLAVDDGGKKLTYRELAHRASLYRTATRALFSARSSAEALAAVVGLLTSPSTAALVDPLSVSEDFAFQLADFSPEVALIDNGVKKRMIKYKGHPVFPRDLELILLRHPAVERAVVKGEPDPEVGEIPVAYVVRRGEVTEDELLSFINSKVAVYKKLRKVYFVEELP